MMDFRIADTFTDSLAKLTGNEQKAVKTTAFDLQLNPANPSMQFHKLANAKDTNFWSVRVNKDIRLIVHKTESSLLLCYVGHHDDAYKWAERRKLETHPKTGAAQLVEIREQIKEIIVPVYVEGETPRPSKPLLFKGVADDVLLGYGVPAEWLDDVKAANEDSLLEVAEHLPSEAAEALLELAVGAYAQAIPQVDANIDPFEHPDAQRRFRVMNDVEELARALDYPWEKWTVFLHPAQRQIVERDYNGPTRVTGSAGTGKTIVALHRAAHLARNHPESRVLLTTFSENLANALKAKLKRLIGNEPRLAERLEVYSMNGIGRRLYELHSSPPQIASKETIIPFLTQAASEVGQQKFSLHFLWTEWDQVVDAWQLETWEAYRDVIRLGRKTRLPEKQRAVLWSIFEKIRAKLKGQGLVTYAGLFSSLAHTLQQASSPPFDFIVVDEAQDISVPQLRFLAAMGDDRPNSLFFAGDLGQRIFQQPFSWKSLGVDIRGRSTTLKINYRTSHQIRMQADRLLAPELSDVDGNTENRSGTVSVFNGPQPTIVVADTISEEMTLVAQWFDERIKEGIKPYEIGVFVRSVRELDRARSSIEKAGLSGQVADHNAETSPDHVYIGTMHLAKGLEFRAVAVMACDDEVIPLQERIESVSDDTDLEEVYNTERHLLYVACTRARDYLLVTGVHPASEFLDDLIQSGT
jgi:superfamily I DNA/RNA helicase/mRNA-degrading endonuclease RelE of RelBE toxin-antitoxin system